MTLTTFIILSLACYAATTVLTISYVAKPVRHAFRALAAKTGSHYLVRWYETTKGLKPLLVDKDEIDPEIEELSGFDPISCHLCAGFWVTLVIMALEGHFNLLEILGVYGLSYAIAIYEPKF